MSNLSLFELTKEQLELISMIEESEDLSGEVDEFTEAALQITKDQYVAKAIDYVAVIQDRQFKVLRAKEAIKQLQGFIAENERVEKKLKEKLQAATQIFGPITAGFTKLSLRKSEETIITDMAKIPEKYLSKQIVISADKTAIKKDIKAGVEIPGALVNTKQNLQIK
jgi:hypothetical protein